MHLFHTCRSLQECPVFYEPTRDIGQTVSRNESLFCYQLVLAPENLITFAHLSVSSAMRFPYSMGERASTIAPRSAKRVFNLRSARPALISLFSLLMISVGVPFGAPMPPHALVSNPGMKSATVGVSGRLSRRVAAVTANGRSLQP